MLRARLARRVLGPLGLVLAMAGCTGSGGDSSRPGPSIPTFDSTSTTAAPTTSAPTRTLPADCASLLSTAQIDLVLGRPFVGRVQAITGIPEPKIKRLERFTCRYGLPEGPLPPGALIPLEVSVSRYADDASATERVTETIELERAHGAAPSEVPTGPVHGTVLVTPERRLLVAANGAITLAVTMAPGIADDRVNDVLADLGGRALAAVP